MWDPYVDGNEKEFRKKYNLNNESSLFLLEQNITISRNSNFTKDQK